MKNKNPLLLAFVFQLLILAYMFLSAYSPVFLGKEIKLKASGVDPIDILAGHYVELDYGINSIKIDYGSNSGYFFDEASKIQDKKYYIELTDEDKDGIYSFDKLYEFNNDILYAVYGDELSNFDKKDVKTVLKDKTYIEAKIQYYNSLTVPSIERYYATKQTALQLERDLRSYDGIVTIKLYKGKARIVDLELVKRSE